jgi:GGDEF domain-containing protein
LFLIATLSPVLSRLSTLCWLLLPPVVIFGLGLALYFYYLETVTPWLTNLGWLGYVGAAIAALIAWQFGRSRLVYASVLMLLILAFPFEISTQEIIEAKFIGVLFCLMYLMFSQDKGLSLANLLISLTMFGLLFLTAWFLVPLLHTATQTGLSGLDSQLFAWFPTIRSVVTPFSFLLLVIVFLVTLVRLIIKPDNSHNALFIFVVAVALVYLASTPALNLITILGLSGLVCFAVLKDSFTMAFKDELTGIPSRRALMQQVLGLGRKYTVVMSDIDHFKKFNDTYGHDVGDEVLKLVASKLSQVLGGGKTFRYGGEEFIMLFPRKTAKEVQPFVEMVRQTIADYDIALRAKPRPPKPKKPVSKKPAKDKIVKVTTSFGIAQRTKHHAEFHDIMKQADIALYAAKKAGRNCVKIAKQ